MEKLIAMSIVAAFLVFAYTDDCPRELINHRENLVAVPAGPDDDRLGGSAECCLITMFPGSDPHRKGR